MTSTAAAPVTVPPAPEPSPPPPADAGRRRFLMACLVGALLAAVPFVWLLFSGRLDLLREEQLGGFYDAQAHSLLDLRWDVPREAVSVEGFVVDGKTYMYFGPTPALFRLPVAALTDELDGRLTQLSLLGALAVTLLSASRLSWRIRSVLRADDPVGKGEAWAAGAFTFLLGAGTSFLFLASRQVVYHEAIAWGVALSLAAFVALFDHLRTSSGRALAAATVLSSLALLARASVGLGPVLALGMLLAVRGFALVRARVRPAPDRPGITWRALVPMALAVALPVLLYVGVNVAKFGTPVSVPWETQVLTDLSTDQERFFEETGGDVFGVRYVPTTALQYARPDATRLDGVFPWAWFPERASIAGDVAFLYVDRSSSVPDTAPWLVVLAGIGAVALVRRRTRGVRRLGRILWAPVAGAALAGLSTLAIAYVAHRYLADFLPFLVLVGLVGLHRLVDLVPGWRPARRRVVVGAMAALGLVAVWTNLSFGLLYQGLYGPGASDGDRGRLVALQEDVDAVLPGEQAPEVSTGPGLPEPGSDGELFVVGDCRGLYLSLETGWQAVERTNGTGRFRFDITFPTTGSGASGGTGTRWPIVVGGPAGQRRTLAAEPRPDGRIAFVYNAVGEDLAVGRPVHVREGTHRLNVVMDRHTHTLAVRLDGRPVLGGFYLGPADDLTPAGGFPGRMDNLPLDAPICRDVLDREGE